MSGILGAIGTWIVANLAEWVIHALLTAGVGLASYIGVQLVFTNVQNYVVQSYGSLPQDVLQILSLCGFPGALGLFLGACSMRITLWVTVHGKQLFFK